MTDPYGDFWPDSSPERDLTEAKARALYDIGASAAVKVIRTRIQTRINQLVDDSLKETSLEAKIVYLGKIVELNALKKWLDT